VRFYFKILIAFIFTLSACKQTETKRANAILIRPSILKLVADIAKDNVLKGEAVGYAGIKTFQWIQYQKLNAESTDSELEALTDNRNAVVRCYAFQALSHRRKVDLYSILIKHLTDTARIETFEGCIVSSQKAGDYFLEVVTPNYVDLLSRKLTKVGRRAIDSILIFDKQIKLFNKYELLEDIKPNLKYYKRIKEIATSENSPVAILALSRFNNKGDIDLIEKLFMEEKTEYYAIYSVKEFPDPAFYTNLVNVFEKEWKSKSYDYSKWRVLYQALAKYPSDETLKLFERTVQSKDDFRYQTLGTYLSIAIKKYPYAIYQPLKSKIKLDEYHLQEVADQMNSEN